MLIVASLVVLATALLPLAALGQANYATPYTFITIAGKAGTSGSNDGTGSAARFNGPVGVAVDTNGNLYVPDVGNNTIRIVKPVGTSWVVTTVAGLAGSPGSADGTNSAARFNFTINVGGENYFGGGPAVDSAGNVYVPDAGNNTIRRVTPVGTNWVVTTLAGKAGVSGSADGTNSAARFYCPLGLAVDTNGSIYVADGLNDTIRRVTPVGTDWVVTTLAGKAGVSGSADGTNGAARFSLPCYPGLDSAGNVYVPDAFNDTVRRVTPVGTNWVVTTLAGRANVSGSADGTNSAARFYEPVQVAVDSAGTLYEADSGNNTIRKITPVGTNWVVTTVAGLAGAEGAVDGTGSTARFNFGSGEGGAVVVDSAGNLYVPDYVNNTIRKGMPASSVPAPILQPPSLSAGQFGFGITGLPGLAVNIESSADMSSWLPLGSTVYTLEGGTNYFVFSFPPQGTRFFRAQVR
jgi:ribosomal protein S11